MNYIGLYLMVFLDIPKTFNISLALRFFSYRLFGDTALQLSKNKCGMNVLRAMGAMLTDSQIKSMLGKSFS